MCSNFSARRCTPGLPSSWDVLTPHSRETRGASTDTRPPAPRSFPARLAAPTKLLTRTAGPTGSVMQTRDAETDGGQTGRQRDRNGRQRDIQRQRQTERAETERRRNIEKETEKDRNTNGQRETNRDRQSRETAQVNREPTGPALPEGHTDPQVRPGRRVYSRLLKAQDRLQ